MTRYRLILLLSIAVEVAYAQNNFDTVAIQPVKVAENISQDQVVTWACLLAKKGH